MGQVIGEDSVVERLEPDRLARYWPAIEKELKKVPHIWEPWWTLDYIYGSVFSGHMMVLAVGSSHLIDMTVICQVARYPTCDILQVIIACGRNMEKHLQPLAGALEVLARQVGCERVEIFGRRGWARKLRPWRPSYEVVQLGFPVFNTRTQ